MGILQNKLGINLTNHDPIVQSPFASDAGEGQSFPPPSDEFMITETGLLMITEVTSAFMLTE